MLSPVSLAVLVCLIWTGEFNGGTLDQMMAGAVWVGFRVKPHWLVLKLDLEAKVPVTGAMVLDKKE